MCVAKPIMLNNEKSYWVGARVVLIRSVMAENCSAGTYEKKSRQASGGSGRPAGQRAGRGGGPNRRKRPPIQKCAPHPDGSLSIPSPART